ELSQQLTRAANLGRALQIKVVPGVVEVKSNGLPPAPAGSAKSRAAEDPLVRHFQQTFNAEIRTVIDQRKN
ncbi:MAG: hypothetical protein JOZ43_06615, partial [Acidobacteriales bacterium]|nr:hypothetical protein [Terriglobales bacterium]